MVIKKYFKIIIGYLSGDLINTGLSLALTYLISYFFGLSFLGSLVTLLSIISLVSGFLNFQIVDWFGIEINENNRNIDKLYFFINLELFTRLLSSILIIIFFLLTEFVSLSLLSLNIYLISFILLSLENLAVSIMRFEKKTYELVFLKNFSNFSRLLIIIFVVISYGKLSFDSFIKLYAIVNFIFFLFCAFLLQERLKGLFFKSSKWLSELRQKNFRARASRMFIASSFSSFTKHGDISFLSQIVGPELTGFYKLAKSFASLYNIFAGALSFIYFRILQETLSTLDVFIKFWKELFFTSILILLVLSSFHFLAGEFIFYLLFPHLSFYRLEIVDILSYVFIFSAATFWVQPLLLASGDINFHMKQSILSAIIFLCSLFLMSELDGLLRVTLSLSCSWVATRIVNLIRVIFYRKLN